MFSQHTVLSFSDRSVCTKSNSLPASNLYPNRVFIPQSDRRPRTAAFPRRLRSRRDNTARYVTVDYVVIRAVLRHKVTRLWRYMRRHKSSLSFANSRSPTSLKQRRQPAEFPSRRATLFPGNSIVAHSYISLSLFHPLPPLLPPFSCKVCLPDGVWRVYRSVAVENKFHPCGGGAKR